MKIKYIRSISLCGLLAFFGACTSQNDVQEPMHPNEDIYLSLDIEQADTRGVVTGTSFDEGAEIRIIVASTEQPDVYYFDTKATYDGKEWIIANPVNLSKYRRQGITDFTVKAIYPYDKTGTYNISGDEVYVETSLDQADIMTGYSELVNRENPTARLVFSHVLSRITFKVINPGKAVNISNVTISETLNSPGYLADKEIVSFKGSESWNLYWLYPDSHTKSISVPCDVKVDQGGTGYIDILLAPTYGLYDYWVTEVGMTKGGLDFTMMVDSNPVKFNLSAPNWYPGQQYTYSLNLPN